MLYKYKHDYQKIAMGLLSFIPDLKDIANIQTELAWYAKDKERRCLFLWSNQAGNFDGIIGVELAEGTVVVRQIAISPTKRNQGVMYTMLDELAQRFFNKQIIGSIELAELIKKWEQHNNAKNK